MSKPLSPDGEVLAAHMAATAAAFQVLVGCLEGTGALVQGQFPHALETYMAVVKSREGVVNDMTLAMLNDILEATAG
ncbi:MAG: hypothetical protein WBF99_12350 [Xanthobacteraceae bacterium]